MEFQGFEYHVNKIVGEAHCNEYRHLLPTVRQSFRQRFLQTLSLGYKIPETLYHINLALRLPDENYRRYIKYVTGTMQATYTGA